MKMIKKALASFLILLMLTPSLVCAMPVCADEARAAAAKQPCAGHHDGHHDSKSSGDSKSGKVNLLKDCMSVDLQVSDNAPVLKKHDLQNGFHFTAITQADIRHDWALTDIRNIRGPPPDWPDLHQTQPSILLTTQRFLI